MGARPRRRSVICLAAAAASLGVLPQTADAGIFVPRGAKAYSFRVSVTAGQAMLWQDPGAPGAVRCHLGPGGSGTEEIRIHEGPYRAKGYVDRKRKTVFIADLRARGRIDRVLDVRPYDEETARECDSTEPFYAQNDCGPRAIVDPHTRRAGVGLQFVGNLGRIGFSSLFRTGVDGTAGQVLFDRCDAFGPPIPIQVKPFHDGVERQLRFMHGFLRTPAARLSVRRLVSGRPYTVRGDSKIEWQGGSVGSVSAEWKATFRRVKR